MSAPAFALPPALEATAPPEERGVARDGVRLMVAWRGDGRLAHARFRDLPGFLRPGDLLVVNVSGTIPAALGARGADGTRVHLHVSTRAPGREDGWWVVELREAGGARPLRGPRPADPLELDGGGTARLAGPHARSSRLWVARFDVPGGLPAHLAEHGRPIRYGYVPGDWPLAAYQTVVGLTPGSAEMPSAGRPLTHELVTRLVAGGVLVAPVTLHTGVSSPEHHEPPYPEPYEVPEATARLVSAVRDWGGRVVAVGTTVVRALETAAAGPTGPGGALRASAGWTDLVIGPDRPLRAVDGLLTGWHEPQATHLQLLRAVGGEALLDRSYRAALDRGYLWHEFGDSHLILP